MIKIVFVFLVLVSMLPNALFTPPAAARSVTTAAPGAGQVVVADVTVFYEPLSPYGRWFNHARYGYCWIPNGVVAGWRPYTHGYWDYTDDGWVWVSDDAWGWGPYHYGRWEFDPGYGWVWIPGTIWAPAWVVWRRGPGFIGWAPLPFEARWEVGRGLIDFDYDRYVQPEWYCFVGERHFGDRYLDPVIEVPGRNVTIIHNTTYVTNNYTVVNNRIVNRGIEREEAQRVSGHNFEVHHVQETNVAGGTKVKGSNVVIYRPSGRNKGPSTPPVAGTSGGGKLSDAESRKLDKQHQKEQQQLADQQSKEKARLEKQHNQELAAAQKQQAKADKRAGGNTTVTQIKGNQENEHQAHDQRWTNEKNAMTGRHTAEKAGQIPPANYTPPKPPKQPQGNPKPPKQGKKP
jgi:hypothetical protein